MKNECFHFLSPLEVQFRLKSRGKLKCVYFGAFSQLLQNLKQTNTASDPRPVWFRKKEEPEEEMEDRESAFTPRLKSNQRRLKRKEVGPKADLEPLNPRGRVGR